MEGPGWCVKICSVQKCERRMKKPYLKDNDNLKKKFYVHEFKKYNLSFYNYITLFS